MTIRECPECGYYSTTREHVEFLQNTVEVVRTCDDCPTQFTVSYTDPVVQDVHTLE